MGLNVTPAIVGALQCQKNSFLKSFTTIVVSCEQEPPKPVKKGEQPSTPKFEVELEDTILFPEGGGQPSDHGFIVDSKGQRQHVDYVKREKLKAIHLTQEPLEVGETVQLELDWKRRLDHMQQHTGQHLLSAVLDKHDLKTLSWNLGELINYIELPRQLSDEEVEQVSQEVNERILEAINIEVEIPDKDSVNQTKIPDDYDVSNGVLRVVKIGELDQNPCCGTHLSSTAQILSIALLHQTSVRKGNSRLHFLAGDRVRKYAVHTHKILKQSSAELSCQFEDLTDKINLLNLNYRKSSKREVLWREETAHYQAESLLQNLKAEDSSKVVYFYRPDVGLDHLNTLLKILSKDVPADKSLVLLSGEGKDGGTLIIFSQEPSKSLEIGKHLQSLISNLKGGGKGKWQGKIKSFEKGELEATIKYLESF